MNTHDYEKLALRTEADQAKILERLQRLGPQAMRLDNGARGLAGDAGEVSSAVMKYIEYGRELDRTNLIEEVGDCLWRLAQICAAGGFSLEEAMAANIRKLSIRYPDKYTDELAANRDKAKERGALRDPANWTAIGYDKPKMEPCCECGEDYPQSELDAGHIYCAKCRAVWCESKVGKHEWVGEPDGLGRCKKCGYVKDCLGESGKSDLDHRFVIQDGHGFGHIDYCPVAPTESHDWEVVRKAQAKGRRCRKCGVIDPNEVE